MATPAGAAVYAPLVRETAISSGAELPDASERATRMAATLTALQPPLPVRLSTALCG